MDSTRISLFRLVYLASRVWLKKIPTAWGGIEVKVKGEGEKEAARRQGKGRGSGSGRWGSSGVGGAELLKAVTHLPPPALRGLIIMCSLVEMK